MKDNEMLIHTNDGIVIRTFNGTIYKDRPATKEEIEKYTN